MRKLTNIVNNIFSFLYTNWFIIPMAISFYGMTAGHWGTQITLQANVILWLLAGSITNQRLKEKDKELEEIKENMEGLYKILEKQHDEI